ncbi:hypothetical protein U0035_11045 [Niabella yanshanensis]|uniref:Uncharacterized protein n=1 Tax=Niabella yanshanensis TaxID=577386 RepID=A0ABZ0WDB3_9BACT|nr:hypothetical protein [Niabella yanshanensis]WQD40684.1 hypothetical protein U0035_11045 [Niabella yanshanensis]
MKNYISQLHGNEQNTVHCIKKLIAGQMNALIIYGFGFETVSMVKRSAFIKKHIKEKRSFTCDLLIITPDPVTIDNAKKTEVQEMIAHFGQVNMTVHTISFVLQQLNNGNLFFNWVHKNAMLLHNHNNSVQLLPPAISSEYWPQVEAFYAADPEMASYLHVNLQPIVKPHPKEKAPAQPPLEIRLTLDTQPGWQAAAPDHVARGNIQ